MIALKIYEVQKFEREGTPFEKLKIGHRGIKRALLDNPTIVDSYVGDANREWINNIPREMQKDLDYNPSDPLAFSDYYSFADDYYLENEAPEDIDSEEFHADFKPTSIMKTVKRTKGTSIHTYIHYQIGKLPDGSKVIKYLDGMGSGYIAKKDWLK